ncbi:MAG: TIGR00159 family protein [Coprobacillus sp.]|nr:TIGR00159 family protein [Coprobacillus sp.]
MWVIKLVLSLGISWTNVLNFIRSAIDLIAVWFLLYYFISMFKSNMKTMQLFKGVLFILIVKLMTSVLGLTTLNFLVDSIINWGVLAIIIIFQPEIRTLLEKMGQTKLTTHKEMSNDEKERLMDELVSAITTLAREQTGALITFERSQSLIDYINTGTKVNADIKSELFLTIFWEGTPLHDGATIIQGDRVACAAAFYPPTNKELSPKYGARHRAAIGISEITDSLTVVVSEETGTISFAVNGELKKIPTKELRASLVNELNWFKSSDEEVNTHES